MKIIESNPFINVDAYTRNVDEKKNINSSNKNNAKGPVQEDSVELSSLTNKITNAKQLIHAIPDIREDKIADLKSQIEKGTYQFKNKELASKILKESLLNDLL